MKIHQSLRRPMIGQYVLVETLGINARNSVFLAAREGIGKSKVFVLKVPTPLGISDLRREAAILSQLHHENIAEVVEDQTYASLAFLALEYVDGITLEDILRLETNGEREPNFKLAFHLAFKIAEILSYLSGRFENPPGTIGPLAHGDLVPKNLILTYDGQIKLIDFGCARVITRNADINISMASIPYASPSRIKNQRVELRDDFFGLGIMMWEICTRSRYWGNLTSDEIRRSLKSFTPKDPGPLQGSIPPSLRKFILHCIQEDYFEGYASVEEILESLQEAQSQILGGPPFFNLGEYANSFSEHHLKSRRRLKRIDELLFTDKPTDPGAWKKILKWLNWAK